MNAMVRLSSATRKQRVPVAEHNRVALRFYTALAEMVNGTARREEWSDLADSCNVVEALGTLGKYDAAVVAPLTQQCIEGLMVAIKCPDGMMRMGATATRAMCQVVALHDDAIAKFSRGSLYDAWELVQQRIYDPQGCEANGLFVVQA